MVNKKYLSIVNLYRLWSRKYDRENNLLMFLEEQVTRKMFNFTGKDILDLGCGTGRYAVPLSKNNQVVAVDISPEMLAKAKKKGGKNITFVNSDIIKYEPDRQFDVILSMLVLDHIKNLDDAARVIFNASKLGTELFISIVDPEFEKIEPNVNKTIFEDYYTDEFYHPLSEYLQVLKKYGFKPIAKKKIIAREKFLKFIELDNSEFIVNRTLGVLYHFRRIR